MNSTATIEQIHVTRRSPSYWRVIFDNPPLNLMGPEFVLRFREIMTEIENDLGVVTGHSGAVDSSTGGVDRDDPGTGDRKRE